MDDYEEKIRCMVVDDEKPALERLTRLLSRNPAIELTGQTTHPEKAIALAKATYPDLIFVDVEMPKKSGFELVEELKQRGLASTIIFVTAYNHYAIKAIRAEAFDYLVKPVDIDDLKEAIDRFIQKRRNAKTVNVPPIFVEKYGLTPREVEILNLLIQGKTSKEIANQLYVSKLTVDTHRRRILEKTQFKSTHELVEHILKNYA